LIFFPPPQRLLQIPPNIVFKVIYIARALRISRQNM